VNVTLDPVSVEAIAQRVAELIRADDAAGEWIDAAEVARRFNVSRDYVYAHAAELGARPLGDGPRARLRFDPAQVATALAPRPHPRTDPMRAKPRPRRHSSEVDLLPIGRTETDHSPKGAK
jgi:hypothetical protein